MPTLKDPIQSHYRCSTCRKTLPSSAFALAHNDAYSRPVQYRCRPCFKTYRQQRKAKRQALEALKELKRPAPDLVVEKPVQISPVKDLTEIYKGMTREAYYKIK